MAKHVHTKLAAAVDARQGKVAAALRWVFAEWAHSVAKKLSRKFAEKVPVSVKKGDLPGHEFHGNQWTGGQGEKDVMDELERHQNLGDKTERNILYDTKSGTRLVDVTGEPHSNTADPVSHPGFKEALNSRNILDIHTHPDSAGPSDADMAHLGWSHVQEMRVVAEDAIHSVKRTAAFDASPWQERTPAKIKEVWNKHVDALFDSKRSLEMSVEQMIEHATRATAKDLKLDYTVTPRIAKKLAKADPATEEIVKEILESLDLDPFGQDVVDEISAELQEMYSSAAKAGLEQVKLEPTDEIVNHLDAAAKDYVEQRGAELVGKKVLDDGSVVDNPNAKWSIAETTRDDLRSILTQGVDEGWSTDTLSTAIQDAGIFGEARADMIARTELANAHVAGNVEGWNQSGQVTGKRSLLGDLHDIPDECDDNADAGIIDFGDDFPSGDGFPPYHPNCVCDVEPILSETEDQPEEQAA